MPQSTVSIKDPAELTRPLSRVAIETTATREGDRLLARLLPLSCREGYASVSLGDLDAGKGGWR